MVVFKIIVLVLLTGVCEGYVPHTRSTSRPSQHPVKSYDDDIYVEIYSKETRGSGKSMKCTKNCTFLYNFGNTIILNCKGEDKKVIHWTDDRGFAASPHAVYRLLITPDDNDINLNLTCKTYFNGIRKQITVKLKVEDESKIVPRVAEVKYFKIGHNWTSNKCYGIAYYPKILENSQSDDHGFVWSTYDNHTIHFQHKYNNGTIFYGINYIKVSNTTENLQTYERVKSKFIFYLNLTQEANKTLNTSEVGLPSELGKVNQRATESGPQSKMVGIVAGVLGSIILILLSGLLYVWYKTIRRRAADDDDTQVVYAEIAERPAAPPPPPRNPVPYAKIIGTLMPRKQAQTNNAYSTDDYQTKDDPYSTVDCQTKDDPYSTDDCQTKDDPYSTDDCQTKDDPYSTVDCQTKDDPYSTVDCQTKDGPYSTVDCQTKDGPYSTVDCQTKDGPYSTIDSKTKDDANRQVKQSLYTVVM